MVDKDDDDLKRLIEAIARSSKRINKAKMPVEKKAPIRTTGRQGLVLRLIRIQEHIVSAESVDPQTLDDIGALLDKVTTLLEERRC